MSELLTVAFLLLLVRHLLLVAWHLLLVAWHLLLVAFLLLVAMPRAPRSFLFLTATHTTHDGLQPRSNSLQPHATHADFAALSKGAFVVLLTFGDCAETSKNERKSKTKQKQSAFLTKFRARKVGHNSHGMDRVVAFCCF